MKRIPATPDFLSVAAGIPLFLSSFKQNFYRNLCC